MALKRTVMQVTVLHDPEIDVEGMNLTGIEEGVAVGEFLIDRMPMWARVLDPSEEVKHCEELGDGKFSARRVCKHPNATSTSSAVNQAVDHLHCPDCDKRWSSD